MLCQGMESYCVRAFAEALEVVPYTLAENAGLNPIQIVTELRNLHAQENGAGAHYGINVKKVKEWEGMAWCVGDYDTACRGHILYSYPRQLPEFWSLSHGGASAMVVGTMPKQRLESSCLLATNIRQVHVVHKP